MKLVETVEVQTPGEIQILDYFTMEPKENGIKVCVKSPVLADWIKTMVPKGSEPVRSNKWGGSYYTIDPALVKTIWPPNVMLDNVGGSLVQTTGGTIYVNLSWLRHTKLSDGIEFTVPIMSAADYEDTLPALSDVIRQIYIQNIRRNILSMNMKEILK